MQQSCTCGPKQLCISSEWGGKEEEQKEKEEKEEEEEEEEEIKNTMQS